MNIKAQFLLKGLKLREEADRKGFEFSNFLVFKIFQKIGYFGLLAFFFYLVYGVFATSMSVWSAIGQYVVANIVVIIINIIYYHILKKKTLIGI